MTHNSNLPPGKKKIYNSACLVTFIHSFNKYLLHSLFFFCVFIYLTALGLCCGLWDLFSCGTQTLSWGLWDLVPWPGLEPGPPTLGAQNLSQWTTREVPSLFILMRVCIWVTQSCPTLCDLMAPVSVEFSRQEYWSGLPFPSPMGLPDPGIEPRSPALWADSLLSKPPENLIEGQKTK